MGTPRNIESAMYGLSVGEFMKIDDWNRVVCVPGGWVYEIWGKDDDSVACCFVPKPIHEPEF
jgi:hypothetical protein